MSLSRERNAFGTAKRNDNPARPLRKPPASDDFFTDSLLESSRIPTPSPQKKQAKSAFASKPRRAIGNTRTLKAAWDATAHNGRPSSSGSEGHALGGKFKPAPYQARRRSPAGPAESRSTPSPSRGRQASISLASPTSDASSPPRGLNDVYQRIADEERLAAQEGEIEEEEEDLTGSTMSHDSLPDDRARLNRIRSSQSPLNFRSSSRNTPQPQAEDANKENQGDDTGLSHASGMSFLEDITDRDLAAKLTPHTQDRARDRARLDKAIQKTTPLAFSKAQVGSRHALTSENLQRSGRRDSSRSMHSSSNGSLRNEDTAPPPNVPRSWGSKGRVDRDWMRKIRERNESQTNGTPKDRNQESSQIDWTATAAEVPLPSIEDSFTPKPDNSQNSAPPSLSKQTSLDRIRQWELNDFTTHNLQVSESPPVRVRTNMPDYFKDREIETLEKRAVTTNRLGEIRKKGSCEILTSKSRSASGGARKEVENHALSEKNEENLKIEEKGEPIPDTPIVVYKASANGIRKEEVTEARPMHDRRDSRDDLQRLAKAVSERPRASATPEDWSLVNEEEAELAKSEDGRPARMARRSQTSSKEVASKRSQSADAARTPRVTGAWTDTILPDTIKTVKQQYSPAKYIQTPHVIGGWIDTPLPSGKRQSSAPASIQKEELPKKTPTDLTKGDSKDTAKDNIDTKAVTKPKSNLPPSALTGLITQAKRKRATANKQHSPITEEDEPTTPNNDTLNLGDATIESLEDLLTLDTADMTTLIRMGAEIEVRDKFKSKSLDGDGDKDTNPDLSADTEFFQRIGTKLERLSTNIHEVKKGISKLENQVSHPNTTGTTTVVKSSTGTTTICEACGHHSHGDSTNINSDLFLTLPLPTQIPIPRLWHPPRKSQGQWLPRPTLLGWIILIIWLWYLVETVMWTWYAPPRYAEYYTWPQKDWEARGRFGERYWEPRWGTVGLNVLVRRWIFGSGIGRMVWNLLATLLRWIGMLVGWTDGFVDEAVNRGFNRTAGAGRPSSMGMGAGHGLGNEGLGRDTVVGLGEDEYL